MLKEWWCGSHCSISAGWGDPQPDRPSIMWVGFLGDQCTWSLRKPAPANEVHGVLQKKGPGLLWTLVGQTSLVPWLITGHPSFEATFVVWLLPTFSLILLLSPLYIHTYFHRPVLPPISVMSQTSCFVSQILLSGTAQPGNANPTFVQHPMQPCPGFP